MSTFEKIYSDDDDDYSHSGSDSDGSIHSGNENNSGDDQSLVENTNQSKLSSTNAESSSQFFDTLQMWKKADLFERTLSANELRRVTTLVLERLREMKESQQDNTNSQQDNTNNQQDNTNNQQNNTNNQQNEPVRPHTKEQFCIWLMNEGIIFQPDMVVEDFFENVINVLGIATFSDIDDNQSSVDAATQKINHLSRCITWQLEGKLHRTDMLANIRLLETRLQQQKQQLNQKEKKNQKPPKLPPFLRRTLLLFFEWIMGQRELPESKETLIKTLSNLATKEFKKRAQQSRALTTREREVYAVAAKLRRRHQATSSSGAASSSSSGSRKTLKTDHLPPTLGELLECIKIFQPVLKIHNPELIFDDILAREVIRYPRDDDDEEEASSSSSDDDYVEVVAPASDDDEEAFEVVDERAHHAPNERFVYVDNNLFEQPPKQSICRQILFYFVFFIFVSSMLSKTIW
eukprot:CAMPEP_0201560380 /NCGR_PEP_ID=MMETSP0173_2-20130828/78240_1 /ASSEMBLY_ACC=CAM_ASM_000268 /TAXON_ID=218659 /ORGANISM="Vexillifera sp., Strain DIVA3 564/2" /LENGTH=461 /DNA_ID=CAMNT_0047974827 /DNA_START=876 /DNA_END=2258 /DNA_ORIENTATION=-